MERLSVSMVAAWLLVLSCTAAALADSATAVKNEEAKQLARKGRVPEALPLFLEVYNESPEAVTALNIAECERWVAEEAEKANAPNAAVHFRKAYNSIEDSARLPRTASDVEKATRLRAELTRHVAVIEIATQPEGAEILIDGESHGVRSSVAVTPGDHAIEVRLVGHDSRESKVTAHTAERVQLRFALQRTMTDVRVATDPPGAQIVVAGRAATPEASPATLRLPTGPARVTVSREGYVSESREFDVSPGAGPLTFTLRRDPRTVATLTVKGGPAGAGINVDGRPIGRVPLPALLLPPTQRPVTLEVHAPELQSWKDLVDLKAGQITMVDVSLAPAPPPPSRLWKWLGYGGGVVFLAGGTIAAVAFRQNRSFYASPERDTYDRVGTLNITADLLMAAGAGAATTSILHRIFSKPPVVSRGSVSVEANHGL